MNSKKDELKKNIVLYYNCKIAPEVFSFDYGYRTDEDIIKIGERIKIAICAGYVPQFNTYEDCMNNKRSSELHYVSMEIVTHDGCMEFPLCGVTFDLDDDLKNIIKAEPCGFDTQKEIFDELINIFNVWNSSMDEFIERLKLLNISLI